MSCVILDPPPTPPPPSLSSFGGQAGGDPLRYAFSHSSSVISACLLTHSVRQGSSVIRLPCVLRPAPFFPPFPHSPTPPFNLFNLFNLFNFFLASCVLRLSNASCPLPQKSRPRREISEPPGTQVRATYPLSREIQARNHAAKCA